MYARLFTQQMLSGYDPRHDEQLLGLQPDYDEAILDYAMKLERQWYEKNNDTTQLDNVTAAANRLLLHRRRGIDDIVEEKATPREKEAKRIGRALSNKPQGAPRSVMLATFATGGACIGLLAYAICDWTIGPYSREMIERAKNVGISIATGATFGSTIYGINLLVEKYWPSSSRHK